MPISPLTFEQEAREEKRFTFPEDLEEIIVPKYNETFEAVIANAPRLKLPHSKLEERMLWNFAREVLLTGLCRELRVLSVAGHENKMYPEVWGEYLSKGTPLLEELYLGRNRLLRGDIKGFQALSRLKLRVFSLRKTRVHGDLTGLLGLLKHLRELDFFETQVEGDVATLSGCTDLESLRINRTKVAGDFEGLSTLVKLKELDLHESHVGGELGALSGLTNLGVLWLKENNCRGHCGPSRTSQPHEAQASDVPEVHGNLVAFSRFIKLQELSLQYTQVRGSVESLVGCYNLREVCLTGRQIQGDIAAFSALAKLTSLFLEGTQVLGYDVVDENRSRAAAALGRQIGEGPSERAADEGAVTRMDLALTPGGVEDGAETGACA